MTFVEEDWKTSEFQNQLENAREDVADQEYNKLRENIQTEAIKVLEKSILNRNFRAVSSVSEINIRQSVVSLMLA